MSFNKLSKVTVVLTASILMSTSLFAAGIKEVSPSSTVAMIENVQANDGSYSFQVLSDTDEFTFTVAADEASSIYNLDSYEIGDYIEINGLENNTADSINYITPLVMSGAINFTPATPVIDVPEIDYGFNNDLDLSVNYSYGYLIESNLVSQNTFVDASYFARGVLDAMDDSADASQLYTMDEMTSFFQSYSAAVQEDSTILPTEFGDLTSLDDVKALATTDDMNQQFAYTYGYMFAANFATSGFPINAEYLAQGFLDGAYGSELEISEYQMQNAIRDFEAQFEAQKAAEAEKLQTENLAKAETFLKTNATADGVIVVNDKLQYKVLTDADGATPTVDDIVTLNYELSTLDGKVLDSSYQRESPSQIPLTQVIEGFKDVVSQMKVGQTVIAWIHPDLGYGVDGNTSVEPNTLLMFKIGLISIDTEELAAQAAETSAN